MITIKNLSFAYKRERLFSELNLSIKPGGICGLLGKNGAGKTTLLKLMAGLLFPQTGSISIMGNSPMKRSPEFLQDLIFLPEVFGLPPVTPEQYKMLYSPFYPKFSSDRFDSLLEDFEITNGKKLNAFSYGQKKKFLIAFGLATNGRLLLLDEPTNGLDIPSKSQFRKAVASCLEDDRILIISTHQARDLESLIDPIIIIDEGRMIFNQSTEAISSKLKVIHQPGPPGEGEALFSEKTLEGFMVVAENHDNEESHIDLEMLFNTVINNSARISRIFQDGGGK
ncbi:MAG: ABC transporter ATP-binding protein [Desulfobacteraceae bacterium]|nr:MAG: ABC transporter ATP-binding protein [Desulfobacteraceae bacterium]